MPKRLFGSRGKNRVKSNITDFQPVSEKSLSARGSQHSDALADRSHLADFQRRRFGDIGAELRVNPPSGNPAYSALPVYFNLRLLPALNTMLDGAVAAGVVRSGINAEELLHAVATCAGYLTTKNPPMREEWSHCWWMACVTERHANRRVPRYTQTITLTCPRLGPGERSFVNLSGLVPLQHTSACLQYAVPYESVGGIGIQARMPCLKDCDRLYRDRNLEDAQTKR
jgi:hypothetical protein